MAARLHEFNRSPSDIVKIVKVHESTLRKRLIEFGDTPTSALTLEEFMTVDLEEEQDPPSFKAARRKDKERLQKLMEEEADHLSELQLEIELQLDKDIKKLRKPKIGIDADIESRDTDAFIQESTIGTIKEIITEGDGLVPNEVEEKVVELGPNIASMGLANSLEDRVTTSINIVEESQEMSLDGIDDDEIDMYIMTEDETRYKDGLWNKVNATYLKEQKEKEERLAKEKEEGKPEKKKRRITTKKKSIMGPSHSAGEAIEKMLQEKRISNKINYDVLKSLNAKPNTKQEILKTENEEGETKIKQIKLSPNDEIIRRSKPTVNLTSRRSKKHVEIGLPIVESEPELEVIIPDQVPEEDCEEDYEDDATTGIEGESEMGVLQMLRQHREEGEDYGFGYYEEDY